MKRHLVLFGSIILILSSCFKDDEAVQPYPRGESLEQTIAIGSKYENQVYFNLEKNKIVKTIPRTFWDIAFSCDGMNTIRLNSGRNMYAAATGQYNINDVTDTNGLIFKWDWANGRADSMAMYQWWLDSQVYVIDLGYNLDNIAIGYLKFKPTLRGDKLSIEYALLSENTTKTGVLEQDDRFNYVYFSFLKDKQVDAEPPKVDYDLIFGQYIYYFEEEDLAYLVSGALINPFNTRSYPEFDLTYNEISSKNIDEEAFSTNADIIGYNWKYFNRGEGIYIVLSDQNYLLIDNNGFYYKLHFIGFYNSAGEKGYPIIASEKI